MTQSKESKSQTKKEKAEAFRRANGSTSKKKNAERDNMMRQGQKHGDRIRHMRSGRSS